MTGQRAYWHIPIEECGEPLVELPLKDFSHNYPHDYQALGAPYGEVSPYFVRASVLDALCEAQKQLGQHQPTWRLFIFDAYRPLAVQEFMANHAFQSLIQGRNLKVQALTDAQKETLWEEVYTIWAPPNRNPLTPPPHSTGGAVDITLYDQVMQNCVDMGSPIDELSARSHPTYFDQQLQNSTLSDVEQAQAERAVKNRQLLCDIMTQVGFCRHPGEWWHFCLGDQMWAWLSEQSDIKAARYGRYDLVDLSR